MGSGFHVHADGTSCTDAHVILDVCKSYENDPSTYLNPGDPDFARVAIGFGNPVKWQFSAHVCKISYPVAEHPEMLAGGIAAGRTPGLDLAVLRLTDRYPFGGKLSESLTTMDGSQITVLPFADVALALGDSISLAGYGYPDTISRNTGNPSVTRGVYSGPLSDANGMWLKTDAVMLSGHSGGPALNAAGQIVGWSIMSAMDKVSGGVLTTDPGLVPAGINLVRPIELAREFITSVLATDDADPDLNPAAQLLVYASINGQCQFSSNEIDQFPHEGCGHEANRVGFLWKRSSNDRLSVYPLARNRSACDFARYAREFSFVHYAGATALYEGNHVLTFTTVSTARDSYEPTTRVEVLPQADNVEMLAGRDLVFLSADHTLEIGEALIRKGVRNVVCYEKGILACAARHFACAFWTTLRSQLDGDHDLARDRPKSLRQAIERAFDSAKMVVSAITKPGGECTVPDLDGRPAKKLAVSVPKYKFTNPETKDISDARALPAGVPVLLPRHTT
jgi:hypothetical protein